MSSESSSWLNNNVLVGFTSKRGEAWHYRKADQGTESNHYPEAIPVDDINRRLFFWDAEESPLVIQATGQAVQGKKAVYRADTGDMFGVFTAEGYTIHQYREWLVNNVLSVLDVSKSELQVASAGLLENGGVAWVQLELPENVKIGDDDFRPFLCATTSHNGKYATSYKTGTTAVVCDNTLAAFHTGAKGFNVKHTKNSGIRVSDARDALELAFVASAQEKEAIEALMNTKITKVQFESILKLTVGTDEDTLPKRLMMQNIYGTHAACKHYTGSAWGVVQAFNTYNQHYTRLNKASIRAEKIMVNFLSGKTEKADLDIVKTIQLVTAK